MTEYSRRTVLKGAAASTVTVGATSAFAVPARAMTAMSSSFSTTYGTTPEGVDYGLWGDIPTSPGPVLVVLSGAIDQALTTGFLKAGTILADSPTNYLCVSIDLPLHGSQVDPDPSVPNGLRGWAHRAANEVDFVAEFNDRMLSVIDHLIDEGLADAGQIAVSGTSRGGFLAYRYAAFDSRVACVVGYSPVTDLHQLAEFEALADSTFVDGLNLQSHLDPLVGRPLFLIIGDRDLRVGTDAAIQFARALSTEAMGNPGPDVENPSFENIDNDWPLSWVLDPPPRSQTVQPSTDFSRTGNWSLRVENSAGHSVGVRTTRLPAEPGADYTAREWVRTASGLPATMFLEFFNGAGKRIHYQYVTPTATGDWAEFSIEATAPAGAVELDVLIYGSVGTAGVSYHDDVTVTKDSGAPTAPSVPSEVALHVLSEPRGHPTPADATALAATWIDQVISGS